MPIYTFEHTCLLTRGLTNQIIILLSVLESLSKQGCVVALAIGSFYEDLYNSDLKKSWFSILNMSVLNQFYPNICLIDKHPTTRIYYFDKNESNTSIDQIISQTQRHCPVTITNQPTQDHHKIVYTWTDGIVRNAHCGAWINKTEKFRHIIESMVFKIHHDSTINEMRTISNKTRIHLMHLRNEVDGIAWWASQNKLTRGQYEFYLQNNYLNSVRTHIPKDEPIIILTGRISGNPVIQILNEEGFQIILCHKRETSRELCALEDLSFAERYVNNGIFIGCKKGSTFSDCLIRNRIKFIKEIHLDLDRIRNPPIVL